ncbi:hypothetical protein D3C77_790630 [compost metagenome]
MHVEAPVGVHILVLPVGSFVGVELVEVADQGGLVRLGGKQFEGYGHGLHGVNRGATRREGKRKRPGSRGA